MSVATWIAKSGDAYFLNTDVAYPVTVEIKSVTINVIVSIAKLRASGVEIAMSQ